MGNKFVIKAANIADYHAHILEELRRGVALTTSDGIRMNSMAISWGMLGIEWNRSVFIAFVRTGRFTHELLTNNPQFTVNIPLGERPEHIIRYLGTHSGHTDDKISSLGLHTIASSNVNVCGIAELPLTIECKVIYRQLQEPKSFTDTEHNIVNTMYPKDIDSSFCGSNRDFHTAFYGEIVGTYLIENQTV